MSYDMTTVFGSEISVHDQIPPYVKQYTGYTGANGVTSMNLGHRGFPVVVKGRWRNSGYNSYDLARTAMKNTLLTFNATHGPATEQTWTYGSWTYYNLQFDHIELIPDSDGREYHYNPLTKVLWVRFVAYFRSLQ